MKTQNKLFKNILGGLFLTSMLGVTTACDPLGIEPTTKVDETRFWENEQLARAYVNNFYLISETGSGDTFQAEQWSDNCQGNYEQDWATYRQETFNKRRYDEDSPYSGPWTGAYKNIHNIYKAIEMISASPAIAEQLKNQLLAESHFFLAYVYFDMIKFWGAVPYVEKALTIEDETYLPQSSREFVFDQILANLDTSIELFNAAGVAKTTGMVNKDVANAFKSRVALYAANAADASGFYTDDAAGLFKFSKNAAHYYNLAYNAANAVVGYSLEPNYEDLFTSQSAHTSVESIWPVMFKDGQRSGFNPTSKNGPDGRYYGATEAFAPSWDFRSGLFPTQDLVDAYLMKDEATGKWMNRWETSQMQALGVTKGVDGEISGETAEYRKMFENRDKRFYATVSYDGAYHGPKSEMYLIQTWVDDTDPVNTLKYSALHAGMRTMDNIKSAPINRGSAQTITGYYSRKYSHLNNLNTDGTLNKTQATTCYFNIRYAEVLLNKAEAALKLGKTDHQAIINQIRNRAGLDNYEGNDWWTEYKTQRRLEFAFENPGHRYFDLLRWSEAEHKSTIDELNKASRGLWISRKGIESDNVELNGYPVEPGDEGYFTPKFYTFNMSKLTSYYDRKFDNARYYFTPFSTTTLRDYKQLQQNPGWTSFTYNQ